MKSAERISDMHVCPLVTGTVPHVGGPVSVGCPTVLPDKLYLPFVKQHHGTFHLTRA